MWGSNDSVYSTFPPFLPLEVKLLRNYTTQLDRLITPSIPPIPHPHRQAGAGKILLSVYELPKDILVQTGALILGADALSVGQLKQGSNSANHHGVTVHSISVTEVLDDSLIRNKSNTQLENEG